MRTSRPSTCGLITLAAMLLLPAAARAQTKVVVLDTIQASLQLKLGVRQAVATALNDLSVPMVPLEDVLPEDASCADAACYAGVAKRVGATHLLLVQGVANPAGYRLALDVRDGETGRTLGTDGKDCELCAEDQLVSTVQEKVTSLWVRVMQEQAAAATPAPAPVPAPSRMEPVTVTEAPPTPAWYEQRTPLLGVGFAALGAISTGFGLYYITQDGKAVERNLNGEGVILRDTGKWGWSLTGIGVAAVLAGSAMVIWGRADDSTVSVAVGPQSVALKGRF